jgi:hypothetical protein
MNNEPVHKVCSMLPLQLKHLSMNIGWNANLKLVIGNRHIRQGRRWWGVGRVWTHAHLGHVIA